MEKRGISIRVVAESGSRPRHEWTLSGAPLVAAASLGFLLLALFGFLLTRVVDLARRAELADRLGRRNAELEQNMQKVLALEQELAGLRGVDREIRAWAGLSPEPRSGGSETAGLSAANDGEAPSSRDAASTPREGPGGREVRASRNGGDAGVAEETAPVAPPRFDARAAAIDVASVSRAHPLQWPVEGWASSEFQEMRSGEGPHSGLDIVAAPGTLVAAAGAGRVVTAGRDAEYGLVIVIDHGDGVETIYGHNAALIVTSGETVTSGQGIARVGSTGRSTAPHLHFEVRKNGCALDPRAFLPARDATDRAAGAQAEIRAD